MTPQVRTPLVACSLAVAVCLGLLWVRGYWRGDAVSGRAGRTYLCVGHARGQVGVVWDRRSPDLGFGWSVGRSSGFDLGLSLGVGEGPAGYRAAGQTVGNVVWFPIWPVVALAAAPPVLW